MSTEAADRLVPTDRRTGSMTAFIVIAVVVAAGEMFAREVRSFQKVPLTVPGRAPNVVGFVDKLALVPPAPVPHRPALLLLGSSQSYASSSSTVNANGGGDEAGSLIDCLAEDIGVPTASYLRFAAGSILPNEMMIAEAWVEAMGYRPSVVVVPLIWTNIAIDRDYRPTFREALQSSEVASTVARRLREADAEPEVLASLDTEAQRAAAEAQLGGGRPLGDVLDDRLTRWARPGVALIGRREDIQAGLQERIIHQIVGRLTPTAVTARAPREETLRFNLAFMRAFVRSLRREGVSVLVYRAPQRTDIPVPVDVRLADIALVPFMRELESLGAVTVDARASVPNSLFGWSGPSKDFNHYLRQGHAAVARTIVDAGNARDAFASLRR